jgi:hypothetical protein
MFEDIFNRPDIVSRHIDAGRREERERFLRHLVTKGYGRGSLAAYSRRLLSIVDELGSATEPSIEQLEVAARRHAAAGGQYRSFM